LAGMFAGLAAVLFVYRATPVAYTWYVLIGSCVTFVVGSAVSRLFPGRQPTHDIGGGEHQST
jgi:solute:Na+ symporter, SSS family